MNDEALTPLFALAASMAYEIRADEKTSPQEKARLMTLFGKLVEIGVLREGELPTLIQKAFSYAEKNHLEDFLERVAPILSETQKVAIVINLYDTMLVDGHIKMGESRVIKKFVRAFDIDNNIAYGVRNFLMLKNDTSIFTDLSHPLNNRTFDLTQLFSAK